jgi:hypothetical protein
MPSGPAMSIIAFRHLDVRLRRRRIARGVIVHEHTQNEISLENNNLRYRQK